MTNTRMTARRMFLAAFAFGLASIGIASTASAHSTSDHRTDGPAVRHQDRRGLVHPGELARWRAMRLYDTNRNGVVDAGERGQFWTYVARSGVYGELAQDEVQRFGQVAYLFDVNRDGRLVGSERRGMDKLNSSLRLFKMLDRNGDLRLTAAECGFSALSPSFREMDTNRDRRLSQQEVRSEILRAYRAGEYRTLARF
jgi:Ca2+-binding EF-hand superfamily protein